MSPFVKILRVPFVSSIFLAASLLFTDLLEAKAQGQTFNNIAAPDKKGPYDVGFRLFDNVPASAGPLPRVQVFYPTDPIDPNFDPTDCPNTYTIQGVVQGVVGTYPRSSPLCAIQNATPAAGPFPLIVHDHGGGAAGADQQRLSQLPVYELLASHGFVVVAPRHSPAAVPPDAPGARRVRDLPKVIDFMLDPSKDPLSSSIDADRIGISGFSTGGRTSLAVAGGWATQGIAADPRVKAMVLYEPGRDNELSDIATISIPYLIMGGTRFVNGVVTVPEVLDATVLATPRIYVQHPEAIHFNYQTDVCSSVDEAREAALLADPTLPEPLTNMTNTTPRVCNTNITIDPNITDLTIRANIRAAALQACNFWNQGEIMFTVLSPLGFAFGGGRNLCPHVGVNSIRSLDVNPVDGFTDEFAPGTNIRLFEGNDQWDSDASTSESPMLEETIVPMIELYTVAFWKKFLEGDGRYMRYLTPGYANTQGLEAVVEIRE